MTALIQVIINSLRGGQVMCIHHHGIPTHSLCIIGHFPGGHELAGTEMSPFWILLKQDDGGGGDNWSCRTCKAPDKLSPPTNQQPVFLQAGCHSYRPTNGVKTQ